MSVQTRSRQSLTGLRLAVATLLLVHGSYRAAHEGYVAGFGEFLTASGIPAGVAVAWAITGWEILGALLLASGRATRWAAAAFAGELLLGIVLVHAREGWFVVGGGRNGMEYGALLIACLLAIAWAAGGERTPGRQVHPGSG